MEKGRLPAMNLRDWCLSQIDFEEELLFADGFDEAILGLTYQNGHSIVLYDRDRCLRTLVDRDDMTFTEALEFFECNVQGSYFGPKTPLFVTMPCDN